MNSKRLQELEKLVKSWGISLESMEYLNQALTHPTYVFENKNLGLIHNQRLEFLGDAVLGVAVGDYLFRHFPTKSEGDLTKMRAAVVCESSLAKLAKNMGLGQYLLLGRGEELGGGRERPSILADAFEAVIGAIYLESGEAVVKKIVVGQLKDEINSLNPDDYGDYKTMLQELVQKHGDESVSYNIVGESGPDHNKRFISGVTYKERLLARGSGRSKKEAEQKAAQAALKNFDSWQSVFNGMHYD